MSTGWTADRRAQQSMRMRASRPWLLSTGPRTAAGKERAARNAYKGGLRASLRQLRRAINEVAQNQRVVLDQLLE
jgi:hypothetical protein